MLVVIGLYIRLKISRRRRLHCLKETGPIAVPFLRLVAHSRPKNTLLGLGARYIEGVTFNMFGVFIIAYVTGALGLPRQTALAGVIIASGHHDFHAAVSTARSS